LIFSVVAQLLVLVLLSKSSTLATHQKLSETLVSSISSPLTAALSLPSSDYSNQYLLIALI
jgi:hypothetical protein